MHDPESEDAAVDESTAATDAVGEVCGCPCKHAAAIQVRVGFIVCKTGGEKLCSECVRPPGTMLECHRGHDE